jgi:cytidylate kinase
MAVITISRQYGSGGNEIATRVSEMLGYTYFDKGLLTRQASSGSSPNETVGALDEAKSSTRVQAIIRAAYEQGNTVIVGRGGQAILKGLPGVLHVRIEAPLDDRIRRVRNQESTGLTEAQDLVIRYDRAAADYLSHLYDLDWADPAHYDLVINTHQLDVEGAAHLIVNAVSFLPLVSQPNKGY